MFKVQLRFEQHCKAIGFGSVIMYCNIIVLVKVIFLKFLWKTYQEKTMNRAVFRKKTFKT